MNTCDLLAALRSRGAVLSVEAGSLRCLAPAGVLPDQLRALASSRKADLVAALTATPPAGARLFFGDVQGSPCAPEPAEQVYHWTWERGPCWFYRTEHGLPAWEFVLRPGVALRRPCVTHRGLRIGWQVCADGRKQLRAECAECGTLIKYLKPPPWNADVEFRAAARPV